MIVRLGAKVWRLYDELRLVAAVIGTALFFLVRPRSWNWARWDLLNRQILAVGIDPTASVCGIAAVIGISVVVQLAFWTRAAGQSELLGPLLVASVARELGPLLTNIVVIVRSSGVMATEVGALKLSSEHRATDVDSTDLFLDSIMPRIAAVAVSTFCLAIVFILAAFASGYLFGALLGTGARNLWSFTNTVLGALRPQDMAGIAAKSILPALYTSACSCVVGLGVEPGADLVRVTQRALNRSILGLFVLSVAMSLAAYL